MRPLLLKISAFGPFASEQIVDFSLLGEQPLFLINGVTGAGKTTLLDAICFALYGKTTGDEREAAQMRCDSAPAELMTSVEFSFSLHDKRYWIKRLPEQWRPKAKGDGFTRQSAEAQLWTLDADHQRSQVIVSQKVTEANREIEVITGLNVDQFRQVMILPQGQFRRLLLADSKDREAIFSQLFSTHIYKRIEHQLRDQALALKRDASKGQDLIQGLLESLGHQKLDELTETVSGFENLVAQAFAAKEGDQKRLLKAQQFFERGKTQSIAFKHLAKLEEEREQLKGEQANIAAVKLQLLRAQEAQKMEQVYAQHHEIQQQIPALQQVSLESQQAVVEGEKSLQIRVVAQQEIPGLRQQLDTCKALLIEYKTHAESANQLNQAQLLFTKTQQVFEQVNKQCTKLESDKQALEAKKGQAQLEIANCTAEIERHKGLELRVADHQRQFGALSNIIALQHRIEGKNSELSQLKTRGAQAADADKDARKQCSLLEMQWHQSQVYRLAAQLQEHEECPVCGGLEHPNPAQVEGVLVTQLQLDQAKEILEVANKALNSQREAYSIQNTHLKEWQQQYQGLIQEYCGSTVVPEQFTIAEAQRLVDASAIELAKAEKSLQQQKNALSKAQQQHQQFENLLLQSVELLEGATTLKNQADKDLSLASAQRMRISELLPQAFQAPGALGLAIESTRQQQLAVEGKALELTERYNQAQSTLSGAKATAIAIGDELARKLVQSQDLAKVWQASLDSSFLKNELEYLQARVEFDALEELRQQIEHYEQRWKRLEGAIESQRETLADAQPVNLVQLEHELQQVQQVRDDSEGHWLALNQQLQTSISTADKINKIKKDNQVIDAQYKIVGTLSDVANGQTGDKLSLQRFVLSALLDDVLVDASMRLQMMSKGRYQLLRKEERAKGNKASGLELEVDDAYTGKQRSVATLSGGESFMAALSLALGLSAVVQAYAGGIQLDTLFIDEGFGSLDAESLELAVRTLVDLQRSGRTIGVISHVTELKEQMPLRIDIKSDQGGSHLQVIGSSA